MGIADLGGPATGALLSDERLGGRCFTPRFAISEVSLHATLDNPFHRRETKVSHRKSLLSVHLSALTIK